MPSSDKKSICLVSGSHLCSNPRLVKEAQALHEAGYDVRVVAGRNYPANDPFDLEIMNQVPWPVERIDYCSGISSRLYRLARKGACILARFQKHPSLAIASMAHHPATHRLSRAASNYPSQLYIGHTLVGLAAAGMAARKHKARLGFDAEDFHPWETTNSTEDAVEARSIRKIESEFLVECTHLTAAAPLIGDAYSETYKIRKPLTVLNVFPLNEAPHRPPDTTQGRIRLYWVSQTIGPGRGLEDLFKILGYVSTPVQVTLRGDIQPDYDKTLKNAANQSGFHGPLVFAAPAPPASMARMAAEHDFGLALELSTPANRDLCLSNKWFTHLLAGIPTLYTPTRGQTDFANALGDAAFRIDPDDPRQSAAALDHLWNNPERMGQAREHAWNLGQNRYNWDVEKHIFLESVKKSLT